MNVAIERPEIISLLYRQEKSDPDYGSCLWARFYLDLNNYTMSIESDCGNYTNGWVPTPKSESFLELLSRMNPDYLLGKISRESVIDGDSTAEAITELLKERAEDECIELEEWDLEQIHDACYHHETIQDVVAAVKDAIISSDLLRAVEQDDYDLYSAVVKDYPAGAKKITEVFANCIRPKIKEIIDGTLTMMSIVGSPKEEE